MNILKNSNKITGLSPINESLGVLNQSQTYLQTIWKNVLIQYKNNLYNLKNIESSTQDCNDICNSLAKVSPLIQSLQSSIYLSMSLNLASIVMILQLYLMHSITNSLHEDNYNGFQFIIDYFKSKSFIIIITSDENTSKSNNQNSIKLQIIFDLIMLSTLLILKEFKEELNKLILLFYISILKTIRLSLKNFANAKKVKDY